MFGKSIKLFKLFGFEIKIDLSWLIIAVLIAWSFSSFFHSELPKLSPIGYWAMGIAASVGLFGSVVFHELWHSLVARRFGLEMKGITLFIFGGVSEMTEEPASSRVEFWMAIAGPLSSILLGGAFYGLYWIAKKGGAAASLYDVLQWLGYINLLLAVFNILPAFPLDGGRVLRSILWGARKDMLWATRVAAGIGSGFAMAFIAVGVLMAIGVPIPVFGVGIVGLWYALIGWFLWTASRQSYQQLLLRKGLEGLKVSRFMEANPVTVPRALSVEHLVEDYIYKNNFKMYPVVDGGKLIGCVTIQKIRDIPRSDWGIHTVGEISGGCAPDNTISPDSDAMEALAQMSRGRLSRLMVVEGDKLVGIITLKDMLQFLSMKLELGDSARS